MNTPSPLIPQGTIPAKGKSSFFFKVVMILAVHVVLIGGMLLQGCKDTNKDNANASNPPADTTVSSADTSNLPPVTNGGMSNAVTAMPSNPGPVAPSIPMQPGPQSNAAMQPVPPMLPPPAVVTPTPTPTPGPTDTKEYVIASGDTLGKLAHRNGVSLKAIIEANPGINPKKLKVGQKVEIPAGTGAVASTGAAGAATPDMGGDTGDTGSYTVKSGDTLSKIAKANHTTYKKLMALNDLKTTSIKVGQKLKVPSRAAAPAETPAAPTAPASAVVPLQPTPAAPSTAAATPTTAAN